MCVQVSGGEEQFDMAEWKLMPRQGKPDRFTLMRGIGSGGDSVLNLKVCVQARVFACACDVCLHACMNVHV